MKQPLLYYHNGPPPLGWFLRIGHLVVHNHRPYFSERYGYRRVWRVFGLAFEWRSHY